MNLRLKPCFSALRLRKTSGLDVFILVAFVLVFTSCAPSKNVKYFANLSDSQVVHLPVLQKPRSVILPDDILDIRIAGANEATASLLNTYTSSNSASPATGSSNNGYSVDSNGDVEFAIMGKVHASGLTKEEFRDKLKEQVSKYLKDPLVLVRFVNFRFTVLGEVRTPGNFVLAQERVTVLDALGLAGDMTNYGRRSSVRIIRDSSGNREVAKLDFTDKSIFTSKYYYLQRNDVLYVEAEKSKRQYEDFSRVSAIVATLASIIALAVTILRK